VNAVAILLAGVARHARALLIGGLVAGIALPGLALAMKPWLPELVAALLFIAALRIGPRQALGAVRDLPVTLGFTLLYQLLMPVVAILALAAAGWIHNSVAMALVLMLSASPVSGGPNLTIMTGNDPAPALRLLILGTAILPLTVLAPLWLLPELGSADQVFAAAGRLLGVITIATGAAFLVRGLLLPSPAANTVKALDGASAIGMAVIVIGLMSAVGPAITGEPLRFAFWLVIVSIANLGLQAVVAVLLRKTRMSRDRAAYAIVAGNRNIALFLIALPPEVTDPLLLFIGCYQIPMYLTPILMRRLYATQEASGG